MIRVKITEGERERLEAEGINTSTTTVKRALKKKGWCYKRFSKTLPRDIPSDKDKQKRVKEIVADINNDIQN